MIPPPPSSGHSHHTRGILLMLTSAAGFTANILLIRALGEIESVNVWLVTCVRFAVGLAVLFVFYRSELQPARIFTRGKLASRGIIGGLSTYFFYLTVVHLGAGRATFIGNTYVILGALFAVVMLGERFRPTLVGGSVAALLGLALLVNPFAGGPQANVYDFIAILGAIGSAHVVVTIRQLHATEHTATIFAAQCVYGLLICGGGALLQLQAIGPLTWAVMIAGGIVAAVGQIAMTHAFRYLPVGEGSLLQMLVPFGTAGGGWLFFQEHFTSLELVGAALILGGSIVSALRR